MEESGVNVRNESGKIKWDLSNDQSPKMAPYDLYRAAIEDPDCEGDGGKRRDREGKEELEEPGGGDTESKEEVLKDGEPNGQFGRTKDEKVLEGFFMDMAMEAVWRGKLADRS
jgi:hypothetical protein